jgi:6,7-dimethyl-8-ribityllumazine synthase
MVHHISGQLVATGLKFGIVVGRFNSFMSEQLLNGAIDVLERHGANPDDITVVRVPGSFELPAVCKKMALSNRYDALIALGVVIRGSTSHYDHVCNEAAKGIAHVSLDTQVPVAFGLVTTDTIEQAIERAGSKAGNKGGDAAMVAIEMASVMKQI